MSAVGNTGVGKKIYEHISTHSPFVCVVVVVVLDILQYLPLMYSWPLLRNYILWSYWNQVKPLERKVPSLYELAEGKCGKSK